MEKNNNVTQLPDTANFEIDLDSMQREAGKKEKIETKIELPYYTETQDYPDLRLESMNNHGSEINEADTNLNVQNNARIEQNESKIILFYDSSQSESESDVCDSKDNLIYRPTIRNDRQPENNINKISKLKQLAMSSIPVEVRSKYNNNYIYEKRGEIADADEKPYEKTEIIPDDKSESYDNDSIIDDTSLSSQSTLDNKSVMSFSSQKTIINYNTDLTGDRLNTAPYTVITTYQTQVYDATIEQVFKQSINQNEADATDGARTQFNASPTFTNSLSDIQSHSQCSYYSANASPPLCSSPLLRKGNPGSALINENAVETSSHPKVTEDDANASEMNKNESNVTLKNLQQRVSDEPIAVETTTVLSTVEIVNETTDHKKLTNATQSFKTATGNNSFFTAVEGNSNKINNNLEKVHTLNSLLATRSASSSSNNNVELKTSDDVRLTDSCSSEPAKTSSVNNFIAQVFGAPMNIANTAKRLKQVCPSKSKTTFSPTLSEEPNDSTSVTANSDTLKAMIIEHEKLLKSYCAKELKEDLAIISEKWQKMAMAFSASLKKLEDNLTQRITEEIRRSSNIMTNTMPEKYKYKPDSSTQSSEPINHAANMTKTRQVPLVSEALFLTPRMDENLFRSRIDEKIKILPAPAIPIIGVEKRSVKPPKYVPTPEYYERQIEDVDTESLRVELEDSVHVTPFYLMRKIIFAPCAILYENMDIFIWVPIFLSLVVSVYFFVFHIII